MDEAGRLLVLDLLAILLQQLAKIDAPPLDIAELMLQAAQIHEGAPGQEAGEEGSAAGTCESHLARRFGG